MSRIISTSERKSESLESCRRSARQLSMNWNSVNAIGKLQFLFDSRNFYFFYFQMIDDSIEESGTIIETCIQCISHHQFIHTFANTLNEHPSDNVIDSFAYVYEYFE